MDALAALAQWPGAVWLRQGTGTAYLFVNAAHILGIGLLIGAIVPLDLRLMGCFRTVPLAALAPFLSRMAAAGAALAIATGAWLFTVRPAEYAANLAFLWKMGLLALALANVALQHLAFGFPGATANGRVPAAVRMTAGASLILWLGVLLAGRWIGFL